MRKTLLAAILASVAFTPVAAFAQDAVFAGDRRHSDYNPDVAEQSANRDDNAQRPQRAEAPRQAPAVQQQTQWQGNRDGGGRAERGQFQPRQEAPAAQAPAPAQSPAGRDGNGGRDWKNRGNGGGNWNRGDRGDFRQPVQNAPVQTAPAPQPQRADRGYPGYDGNRRYDGNRPQSGQRYDGNRGQYDRRAPQQQGRNWDGGNRNGWNSDRNWTGTRGWNGSDRNYGRPDYNRNWRSNNRYDWQRYRTSHRQAFRLPRYYAPSGWDYGYRHFSIGAYLDQGLFDRSYWIDSPYDYRLPEVEWPYRWVRYYNDALLVDTESGEVVDVISDIFW